MTWVALEELLETLESASAKGHHDQVLVDSTAACIQLAQLYMRFLDLRAKTRAIRGQFDRALDDTATMQQLAPTSALGYLRAGYIHDMRGLRLEAIRVYDQGLNHVSTEDPAYQLVVKAKSSSQEALNYRFDFMSHLPPDILSNIVPRFVGDAALSSDKVYPYLNVSRTWHRVIPTMDSLHFILDQPQTLDQGYDQLVSVSKHVKTLTLQKCPKTINRLFNRASFDSLTQLTIKECTITTDDSFLLMLRALGKNLTHLTISKLTLLDKSSIDLKWILLDCSCPNLKSIVISNVSVVVNPLNHLYPKLEELSLTGTGHKIGKESIQHLLSCFPSLKVVSLDSSLDPCLLPVVQEKCPLLQFIWFGSIQASTTTYGGSASSTGICDVTLDLERKSGAKHAETVGFLVKHCQTLEGCRLYFGPTELVHEDGMVSLPSDITFNVLDTLHIASREEGVYQQSDISLFEWIIQRSPNLRSIYLNGTAAIQSQVIQPMCKLAFLKSAIFNECRENQVAPILQFLQHHHSLGTQSTLQRIALSFIELTASSHRLFSAVMQLSQLQMLRIEVSMRPERVNLVNFVKGLAVGCPKLENLTLIVRSGIHSAVLSQLCLITSLKTLTLFLKQLSYEDAVALTNCHGLEKLSLYGVNPTPDVAKLLKTRIPTFTCTINSFICLTLL